MQADIAASPGAIYGEIPLQDCWQLVLLIINTLGVCIWPEPLMVSNHPENFDALLLVVLAMLYLVEAANVIMQGAPVRVIQAQLCNQFVKSVNLIDHKISSARELQTIRPLKMLLL